MLKLKNCVQLIGNLGGDPEVKESKNGNPFVKMSMATSESYVKEGEKVTDTQWHNLIAFGQVAKIVAKYLKKGNEIAVEGKLSHRSFEDAKGKKVTYTEVVITELLMLGGAKFKTT